MSVQKQIWEMCSERGADALGSQRRYSMAMTCLAPSILGGGLLPQGSETRRRGDLDAASAPGYRPDDDEWAL